MVADKHEITYNADDVIPNEREESISVEIPWVLKGL